MKNMTLIELSEIEGGGLGTLIKEGARLILGNEIYSSARDIVDGAINDFVDGWNSVKDYDCE